MLYCVNVVATLNLTRAPCYSCPPWCTARGWPGAWCRHCSAPPWRATSPTLCGILPHGSTEEGNQPQVMMEIRAPGREGKGGWGQAVDTGKASREEGPVVMQRLYHHIAMWFPVFILMVYCGFNLMIMVVGLQLSHVSLKSRNVLLHNCMLGSNLQSVSGQN